MGPLTELTPPSVKQKEDGFSYITGCIYSSIKDLARFSYLLINNNTKIKLNGTSTRINSTSFKLPESRFIIPGKYQCLIESSELYNERITSPSSPNILMPGRCTARNLPNFLRFLKFSKIKPFQISESIQFLLSLRNRKFQNGS